MARRTIQDQPDLTIPEDTIVRAKLMEIKDETVDYIDKKTGEKKSFDKTIMWWEVQDSQYRLPDGTARKLRLECSGQVTNHPNNRFRQVAEALLGRELHAGMDIDDDDLIGLSADISIRHEHYEKNGQQRIAEKIDEVMPVSGVMDEVPF